MERSLQKIIMHKFIHKITIMKIIILVVVEQIWLQCR